MNRDDTMRALAGSITPAQLEALAKVLEPAQMLALVDLWTSYADEGTRTDWHDEDPAQLVSAAKRNEHARAELRYRVALTRGVLCERAPDPAAPLVGCVRPACNVVDRVPVCLECMTTAERDAWRELRAKHGLPLPAGLVSRFGRPDVLETAAAALGQPGGVYADKEPP